MTTARTLKTGIITIALAISSLSFAQIPDLLNAFDSGGRAMGMGGGSRVTDANTHSALDNPAGLAFVDGRMTEVSFRNHPESRTFASGNFGDRTTTTDSMVGKMAISHLGTTMQVWGGTLGLSYTNTGFINDFATGNNLANNGLSVRNLQERTKAQIDMFAISFGKRMRDLNVGYGLVVASTYARSSQSYSLFDGGNNNVGSVNSDISGNGIGVGLVAGVQGQSGGSSPTSWGFSLRTPIDLTGNGSSSVVLDRVPGKLAFGIAGRGGQRANSDEFWTWAMEGDYYFGGQGGKLIDRDAVFGFGGGLEYNFMRFGGRIPVRLGYSFVPSGGNGFDDRKALTFGLGYRPFSSDFSFDLNFARPSGSSGFDMALGVTYRPSK